MNNETWTNCQLEDYNNSMYCKIVNQIGVIPERNTFIYDISYYIFFIAFIIVILSPIYALFKIINEIRKK